MKLYEDAKQGSNSNLDELNNILFPDLDACLSFFLDKKYLLLLSSSIENILADDNNPVTIEKTDFRHVPIVSEFMRVKELRKHQNQPLLEIPTAIALESWNSPLSIPGLGMLPYRNIDICRFRDIYISQY